MRAIARLTAVLLATSAVAEPLNYDSCENIQDSREYAHCIATLGAAGGERRPRPRRRKLRLPRCSRRRQPRRKPRLQRKEAPAPRPVAVRTRGGRVVYRAPPRVAGTRPRPVRRA